MEINVAHHQNLFTHKISLSIPSFRMFKSFASHPNSRTTKTSFPLRSVSTNSSTLKSSCQSSSVTSTNTTSTFTWDDVVRVSQPDYIPNDSSDLSGFFEKIQLCNNGSEFRSDFIPFKVEDQTIGYIHKEFLEQLRRFKDVFVFLKSDHIPYVALHERLKTVEDRTRAVAEVIKCLGDEKLIPGIRNELFPVVSSFGSPVYFLMERAACWYFGIKIYGVHMNGYVERDGQKFLWISKRSEGKSTHPGMLDHLVAGGLPHGISCSENVKKECEEEAGIPRSISHKVVPVGAVSYVSIDGYTYTRDVIFCYDLKVPDGFIPNNQDGEVDSFKLMPVEHVANIAKRKHYFKDNCHLAVIDFLFRHGYITPECQGYLDLLQSLRSGDCS